MRAFLHESALPRVTASKTERRDSCPRTYILSLGPFPDLCLMSQAGGDEPTAEN